MGIGSFYSAEGDSAALNQGFLIPAGNLHQPLHEFNVPAFYVRILNQLSAAGDQSFLPGRIPDGKAPVPLVLRNLLHRVHPAFKQAGHFLINPGNLRPGIFQFIHFHSVLLPVSAFTGSFSEKDSFQ
jgi:hypothetical protein